MNKKFDVIGDDKLRNALLNFSSKAGLNKTQQKYLNTYISKYKNVKLDTLNWETICDISSNIESSHIRFVFAWFNANFIKYLIENRLYEDTFIDSNLDIILNLLNLLDSKERRNRIMILNNNINLKNLLVIYVLDIKKDGNKVEHPLIIDTKLDNCFLVELLDGFYKSDLFSSRRLYNNYDFARKFYESYDKFSNFKHITDFNYKVFEKQFDFYKENKAELKALIKFYIYIHSIYEDIFKPTDPVDILWMTTDSRFINQYNDGFRLVDINPIESFPANDRWKVRPNGQEKFTTKINVTNYLAFNFTKINYAEYIPFAKDFIWTSTHTLPTRVTIFYYIIEFLNFIYEHKTLNINKKNNSDYNKITAAEIVSYLGYISDKDSLHVYNDKILSIRNFLKKNYFEVELAVFDFLVHGGTHTPSGSKSIPENELKKLDKHLLELSYTSDTYYVYYTIFRLALDTNFRINYLLSITTDSIKEAMKKGQYYIEAITKTSNKEKVKENISKYAYRYLENAIEKTKNLRDKSPKEYENFVFLYDMQRGNLKVTMPISANVFNTFLKHECNNIGLPIYTAENLRDTSITRAFDYAQENGLSHQETELLVRGKRSIKLKHYYDALESKLFVEATYGIIIGNVDLKGQILETTDSSSFSKDEMMDDGCGFCREKECRIHEDIGCPMCKFFIVTLDRIPFYQKKLQQLDIAIENETIEHEKDHIKAIKGLYAAYLAKLYELKQKLKL
ncbi:Phage integrase family [uncultured Clostridium sp.]|nr:Phage integrase family [uncultured Clostridium sp.]